MISSKLKRFIYSNRLVFLIIGLNCGAFVGAQQLMGSFGPYGEMLTVLNKGVLAAGLACLVLSLTGVIFEKIQFRNRSNERTE